MQKTAYEVRISDWSSDVCSSDLIEFRSRPQDIQGGLHHVIARAGKRQVDDAPLSRLDALFAQAGAGFLAGRHHVDAAQGKLVDGHGSPAARRGPHADATPARAGPGCPPLPQARPDLNTPPRGFTPDNPPLH